MPAFWRSRRGWLPAESTIRSASGMAKAKHGQTLLWRPTATWQQRSSAQVGSGRPRGPCARRLDLLVVGAARSFPRRKQILASRPQYLAFNHPGTLLAAVEDNGNLWVFRPEDSTMGSPIAMPAGAQAIAFSHSDKLLAVAGHDLAVRLFDTESRKIIRTFKGHDAKVNDVAFSPDDSEIAVATESGQVKIWRVDANPSFRSLDVPMSSARSAALSENGKWVAVGYRDGSVWLRSLTTPDVSHELAKPDDRYMARTVHFSQDSLYVLADMTTNCWRVWDLSSSAPSFVADQGKPFAFDLSHSRGMRVVDGSVSTEVVVKPVEGETVLHRFSVANHILHLRFDSTASRVIICATSGDYLWDFAKDQSVRLEGDKYGWSKHCKFSPTDDGFAIAFDNHVVLRAADGTPHAVLHDHAGFTGAMAFSPDGQTLATSSEDAKIRLWHVPTGQEMLTLDNVDQPICGDLCFSEDGRILYSVGIDENQEGSVLAWPTR